MMEVVGDVYIGDGDEGRHARIFHFLTDHFGEDFLEKGIEPLDPFFFCHILEILFKIGDLIGFDDVVFLDVIESLQDDSALEAFADFSNIIFTPFDGGDRSFPDDFSIAFDAGEMVSFDDSIGHLASRNFAEV